MCTEYEMHCKGENPYNIKKSSLCMNARTLRKTLDDYGFETEKVLDCLLGIYIKQHVSDRGVLAQDIPGYTGLLNSYHLVEKDVWNKVILFKCTSKGEKVAQQLVKERVPPVFEQFKQLNVEGTYLILKYLLYLVNQGKNKSTKRLELKLLSFLPIVQDTASSVRSLLLEHGLARAPHRFTASGSTQQVAVTLPDLYTYFEPFYQKEDIGPFDTVLTSVSRTLNIFRLLYSYDPKAERIYMRKLREYNFSLQDLSDILEMMKQKKLISYSHNSLLFRIEDEKGYKKFLKDHILSEALNEFSHQLKQPIRNNPQAYALLADFEDEFRTFLEEVLKKGQQSWEERIPEEIVKRLGERRDDAQIRRKTVYSLLHYIDFPNYLSIILHRTDKFNNWELFEPYFVSIGWVKGRLIELNEIRNDLAHPKPLEPLQYRKLQLYIDEIRERMRR